MFFRGFLFILILILGSSIEGFKILVIFTTPSLSHQRPIMALTEKLVKEGHEVYAVSPNEVPGLKNDNYTFVNLSIAYDIPTPQFQRRLSKWDMVAMNEETGIINSAKLLFLSEPFKQFQRRVEEEKIKFDVTILESWFMPLSCPMSRLLTGDSPIISMSTFSTDFYAEDPLGSILHLSNVPSWYEAYTDKMSLWQRMENWFSEHYIKYTLWNVFERASRSFFKEAYNAEHLVDGCWNNASLSMIASNSLYYYPRLLGPNVIELGPLHMKPAEKLPKNLQDWLDGAEKGVIYFSLGTNMKSKSLPVNVLSKFLEFFRKLPPGYRVLWKWETDEKIPGQSDNILGQKWLPQLSVLAHPKVQVFITQGGLQSFQEAVHYGVPTVVIPRFGDQENIAAKMEDLQIGVRIGPQELQSYDKIKSAIESVLFDDRYSRNMKAHSALSREFSFQALDKATFWVEHVARHGGASHLRPSTADSSYAQFFCLDIIFATLALALIAIATIYLAGKLLIREAIKIFKKFKKNAALSRNYVKNLSNHANLVHTKFLSRSLFLFLIFFTLINAGNLPCGGPEAVVDVISNILFC